MYVMATFEHTIFLELGISALERQNIPKEHILAVPLNTRTEQRKAFDNIHQADGISLFDLGAALATAFSVIGASVGFHLEWGPIIWEIAGASVGFVAGFLIKFIMTRKAKHNHLKKTKGKISELILIIQCESDQVEMIENILWDNLAFGVAALDLE
ncbi:hypothetical protein [Lentibacillus salicampi]|uniref:hypothetical protein n=1 Tax=Lentibacillus salicampi TaxID=175306 RepID=UPI001430215B|nr:hypothetical protein [Lentibacillus salicampi]